MAAMRQQGGCMCPGQVCRGGGEGRVKECHTVIRLVYYWIGAAEYRGDSARQVLRDEKAV